MEVTDDLLDAEPIKILQGILTGLQLSIGDLEQLAAASIEERHLSAAIGAKKAANEARDRLGALLQSVGVLPHELGTLRFEFEFKALIVRIVDTVDRFVEGVERMRLPKNRREEIVDLAHQLSTGLEKMSDSPNGGGES